MNSLTDKEKEEIKYLINSIMETCNGFAYHCRDPEEAYGFQVSIGSMLGKINRLLGMNE